MEAVKSFQNVSEAGNPSKMSVTIYQPTHHIPGDLKFSSTPL
jgi:hypothetical protein